MKYLFILIILILTALQAFSQTISTPSADSVKISFSDLRIILNDLLDKQVSDSLLVEYEKRDSLQTGIIQLHKQEIIELRHMTDNYQIIENGYQEIIENNNDYVKLMDNIVKQQEKTIRQYKFIVIGGTVVVISLPIVLLVLTN